MLHVTVFHPTTTDKTENRLFAFLKNLYAGLREGHAAYARYARLSALNDNELKAMGLARQDIGRAAMFPTDGGRAA